MAFLHRDRTYGVALVIFPFQRFSATRSSVAPPGTHGSLNAEPIVQRRRRGLFVETRLPKSSSPHSGRPIPIFISVVLRKRTRHFRENSTRRSFFGCGTPHGASASPGEISSSFRSFPYVVQFVKGSGMNIHFPPSAPAPNFSRSPPNQFLHKCRFLNEFCFLSVKSCFLAPLAS
jgi:hypothetical protein